MPSTSIPSLNSKSFHTVTYRGSVSAPIHVYRFQHNGHVYVYQARNNSRYWQNTMKKKKKGQTDTSENGCEGRSQLCGALDINNIIKEDCDAMIVQGNIINAKGYHQRRKMRKHKNSVPRFVLGQQNQCSESCQPQQMRQPSWDPARECGRHWTACPYQGVFSRHCRPRQTQGYPG